MKTNNSVRIIGATAVTLLLALNANAIIAYGGDVAYNNPAITGNRAGGDVSLGMDFTVNTPGSVTAIGAFDSGQDGFSGTVYVAIYNASGTQVPGTLATFAGTSGTLFGGSQFLDIPDVSLGLGSYRIVAFYSSTSDYYASTYLTPYDNNHPWTFDGNPYLTHNSSYYLNGSSLQYPTTWHNYPQPSFAAGTFSFAPVPEVGTFGAAAVGLLGLVYGARHFRNHRKIQGA